MKTPFIIDPILAEAHAIKDQISEEFHHDVRALCRHLQTLDATAQPQRGGRQPPSRPLNPTRKLKPVGNRLRSKRKIGFTKLAP
jgi:hypothetical protein